MNKKINTHDEAVAHILGRIAGLNDIRIAFWGIGWDKDKTAQRVRKIATDKIYELKEILEIKIIGDSWFDDASSLINRMDGKDA